MTDLLPISGLEKTSEAFREKLVAIASALHIDPSAMAAVMKIESAFNPAATNKQGGATGLIQFMPKTAVLLGTTTDALRQMTAEAQLDFVQKFYEPFKSKILDDGDHYIATFMPAFLGKPIDTIIAKKGEKVYDQNAGLDITNDGILTVRDVKGRLERETQTARAQVAKGTKKPIVVEDSVPKGPGAGRSSHGPLFSELPVSSSSPRPAGSSARDAALRGRVRRYFRDHPEGLSPAQIRGWAGSVRKIGPFSQSDIDHAFRCMMAEGEIAIANGLYYKRVPRPKDNALGLGA